MRAFGYAIEGLAYLVRTQRSFRLHLAASAAVGVAGLASGLSVTGWALVTLAVALVLVLEGVNTGIELAVTLASPERRPEAKAAKDIAAGMVLLAAIAAAAIGGLVFGPHIRTLFHP